MSNFSASGLTSADLTILVASLVVELNSGAVSELIRDENSPEFRGKTQRHEPDLVSRLVSTSACVGVADQWGERADKIETLDETVAETSLKLFESSRSFRQEPSGFPGNLEISQKGTMTEHSILRLQ